MSQPSKHLLLTFEEVAMIERVKPRVIRGRVERGKLPAESNGGRRMIPLSALSPTAQKRAMEIVQERMAESAGA